jgi:hypothetical protein
MMTCRLAALSVLRCKAERCKASGHHHVLLRVLHVNPIPNDGLIVEVDECSHPPQAEMKAIEHLSGEA